MSIIDRIKIEILNSYDGYLFKFRCQFDTVQPFCPDIYLKSEYLTKQIYILSHDIPREIYGNIKENYIPFDVVPQKDIVQSNFIELCLLFDNEAEMIKWKLKS